jgi:hypothetical protein
MKQAPAPNLAQDWRTYDRPEHGFSIAAPSSWGLTPKSSLSLNLPDGGGAGDNAVQQMMQQAEAEDEEAAAQMAKADLEKGIYLTLYDRSVRPMIGEVPTSMAVFRKPTLGSLDADVQAFLKSKLDKERKSDQRISLPIGQAHEAVTELTDIKGDVVKRITYIVSHNEYQYQIVFRQTNGSGTIDGISRQIVETLRLK